MSIRQANCWYTDEGVLLFEGDGWDLLAEVVRLQGIVDKLPKCWRLNKAGKRVRDVPVVPGMTVYIWCGDAIMRSVITDGWRREEDGEFFYDVKYKHGRKMVWGAKLFSTREAAKAAGGR